MSWHPDAGPTKPASTGEGASTGDPAPPAAPPPPASRLPGPDGERSSPNRRALAVAGTVVVALLAVVALVGGGPRPPGSATFPPVGATTGPAGGAATATRNVVARALAAQGLGSEDATRAFRPAEAPRFATAPRLVLRAILPDDPDHGLIVIYEFSSPGAAADAAGEQAAYLASGVGRVQFTPDSRFVIRVIGATAVFFAWAPASSPDPRTTAIAAALETVGLAIPVPN